MSSTVRPAAPPLLEARKGPGPFVPRRGGWWPAIVAVVLVHALAINDRWSISPDAGLSACLFIAATRIQTDVLFTCLVAAGIYCFVRASDSSPAWGVPEGWHAPPAAAALQATGVFESPQVFGKAAVYTRRTKDGGPP